MSVRKKLNQGYIQGSFVIAGVIGGVCGSWTVFWTTAFILIALSTHSGEIRFGRRLTHDADRPDRRPPRNRDPR